MGYTLVKIAFRNLLKNRRRSAFTVAAIGIGYAAVVVFGGFTAYVFDSLEQSIIYGSGNGHLSEADAAVVGRDSSVNQNLKARVHEPLTGPFGQQPILEAPARQRHRRLGHRAGHLHDGLRQGIVKSRCDGRDVDSSPGVLQYSANGRDPIHHQTVIPTRIPPIEGTHISRIRAQTLSRRKW